MVFERALRVLQGVVAGGGAAVDAANAEGALCSATPLWLFRLRGGLRLPPLFFPRCCPSSTAGLSATAAATAPKLRLSSPSPHPTVPLDDARRAAVAAATTAQELWAAFGTDAWVVVPVGSTTRPGHTLEGTRLTVVNFSKGPGAAEAAADARGLGGGGEDEAAQ